MKRNVRILSLLTALLMLLASIGFAEGAVEEITAELPELVTAEEPEQAAEELPEAEEELPEAEEEIPEIEEEIPAEEPVIEEIKAKAAVAAGDYYIISNGYALGNNNGSVTTAKVTVSGSNVSFPSGAAESQFRWTAAANSSYSRGSFTLKNGSYLVKQVDPASGNSSSVATELTTSVSEYTVWEYDSSSKYLYSQASSSTKYYLYYSNSYDDFRTHNQTSGNNSNHNCELVSCASQQPGVSIDAVTVREGKTVSVTASPRGVSGTPTYSWKIDKTEIATVSGSGATATVSGVKAGSATLTVTMTAGGTSYTATANVTVSTLSGGKITDPADLADGDEVIIVSNGYALYNDNGTAAAAKVTIEGGNVVLPGNIAESKFYWTLEKTGSQYRLKNDGLYVTHVDPQGNQEPVKVTLTSGTSKNAWTLDVGTSKIHLDSGSNTYWMYYSNTNVGFHTHYQSSGNSSHDSDLYAVGSKNPGIRMTDSVELRVDKTADVSVTLNYLTNPSISWSVGSSSIATVTGSGTTVTVKGVKAGSTTLTVTVTAGGKTYTATATVTVREQTSAKSLFIATDRHDYNETRSDGELVKMLNIAENWLAENYGGGIATTVLGGDNVAGSSRQGQGGAGMTYPYNVSILDAEIRIALPDITAADTFYTWGSHDGEASDSDTEFLGHGNVTPYVDRGDYYIYGVDYYDILNYSQGTEKAQKFLSWAAKADNTKPVIMVSHIPLHHQRNDQKAAETWAKTINQAAEQYKLDIIFVYGHNHTTEGMNAVYYAKGDTLNVERDNTAGGTSITLGFTYLNGGYLVSNNNTAEATTYTIDKANKRVLIDRYNLNGHTGTKTVALTGGGTPTPQTNVTVTYHTNGTTATATVVSGQAPAKPADPAAITESTGLNAAITWTFENWYSDAACTVKFDFTKAVTANTDVYAQYSYETYMGDIDRNGKVNGNDATMILQSKVRLYTLDAYQEQVADLSGNGTVGSEDATYVLQTAARILDAKPVTLYKK